jgi:hypothetical protein
MTHICHRSPPDMAYNATCPTLSSASKRHNPVTRMALVVGMATSGQHCTTHQYVCVPFTEPGMMESSIVIRCGVAML